MLDAFREGQFDQIEIIGEADEKEFFERCFKEKILEALSKQMPTARKKQEVPLWFELAANLSLKLHLENSYSSFEEVVQCGGLLSAMPPEMASKHLDPKSKAIYIQCQGFNDKNHYARKTPCHQDTLRKAVKDVPCVKPLDSEKNAYLSLPEVGRGFTFVGNKSSGYYRGVVKSLAAGKITVEFEKCPE